MTVLYDTINSFDDDSDQKFASNISIKRTVTLHPPSSGRKCVNWNRALKYSNKNLQENVTAMVGGHLIPPWLLMEGS